MHIKTNTCINNQNCVYKKKFKEKYFGHVGKKHTDIGKRGGGRANVIFLPTIFVRFLFPPYFLSFRRRKPKLCSPLKKKLKNVSVNE